MMHKFFAFLSTVLLAVAFGAGNAAAHDEFQYAVKFVCGGVTDTVAVRGVLKGNYRTAINIHNPGAESVLAIKRALSFPDSNVTDPELEHFLSLANRRGFPSRRISDSRFRLEEEASLDDETSFK